MAGMEIKVDVQAVDKALTDVRRDLPALRRRILEQVTEKAQAVSKNKAPVDTDNLRRAIITQFLTTATAQVVADYPASGKPYYSYVPEYGVEGGKRGNRKALHYMDKGRKAGRRMIKGIAANEMSKVIQKAGLL